MGMAKTPSVAIIIINWNGYELSKACLQSLGMVAYPNFKIILVDNGSEDGSGKALKTHFPEIELVESKTNLGFTGGNNLGIDEAFKRPIDYILLLNNDTLVDPDFLDPLVGFLENNPVYAAAQPKIRYAGEKDKIWNAGGGYFRCLEMTWSIGIGKMDTGQFEAEKDTPWITGCAFLVRADVIRELGSLDDRFFAYYEDVDWSFRMRKRGYKLRFLPQSKIYHEAGASSKKTPTPGEGVIPPIIHYYRTRNHLLLIRNHANAISFTLSLAYQTIKNLSFIIYLSLRGRYKKVKAIMNGQIDGLIKS